MKGFKDTMIPYPFSGFGMVLTPFSGVICRDGALDMILETAFLSMTRRTWSTRHRRRLPEIGHEPVWVHWLRLPLRQVCQTMEAAQEVQLDWPKLRLIGA